MSRPVIPLPAEAPAFEAAEVMRTRRIRRLVVVDAEGRTVGVATQSDLVRGLESKYIETLKSIIRDQGQDLERAVRDLSEKTLYLDNILSSAMDMGIVATDTRFQVVYASASAAAILGHEGLEALGRNVREIHAALGVGEKTFGQVIESVTAGVPHSFSISRGQGQAKRCIDARVSAVRGKTELMGYVLTVQDVTQRKLAEETIRYLAYHDTLTGLPNRALFNERLVMDLARCRRHGTRLALCVLDLDRFKEINDTLGHHTGDEVLRGVGRRLARRLRETDTVARMGGDEFMVILPDLKETGAARGTAEKLVRAFDDPVLLESGPLAVRLSLGAARFPRDGVEAEDLMRLADRAMYQAKELGRANGGSNLVFCG
jgi:diguanylate cyclase (GGDEF)-like protein/PAS domain S-box-containing protein